MPAPTLARSITVVAVACYALVSALEVGATRPGRTALIACCACLAVLFLLQLRHSAPGARYAGCGARAVTLSAQALMTYLPLALFGRQWGGMAGFLAASVLLLVPGAAGWALYALITLSMVVYPLGTGMGMGATAYFTLATALTGLIVYGLSTLSRLIIALHTAHRELARVAVSNERLRVAQDLHDLLSYSLAAITLKSELTARLIGAQPHRAREEVAGVLKLSRQALADVRTVASGYRRMSLPEEAASARTILAAADITAEVDVALGTLDPDIETVLATVLREGVANALRHSRMRRCRIHAGRSGATLSLTLVNDGVQKEPGAVAPGSGNGLGNLRLRLTAVGGHLSSRIDCNGHFRLVAVTPLVPVPGQDEGAARPDPEFAADRSGNAA